MTDADRAVSLLESVQRKIPDQVAELMEQYVNASDDWDRRLAFLMRWVDLDGSRRFFDLFLRLLDQGVLDEAHNQGGFNDFWSLIQPLGEAHPDWASEAIGHYLTRRLALSRTNGQNNPFNGEARTIPESGYDDIVAMRAAQGAPSIFVAQVLPFMLTVMENAVAKAGTPPWHDSVWVYRSFDSREHSVSGALLSAMVAALSRLAAGEPEAFLPVEEQLSQSRCETAQFLLLRAYAAGPRHADAAITYLCEEPRRLESGYMEQSHWAARQLLDSVTPFCSDESLARIEAILLDYHTDWEKSRGGRSGFGYCQFLLLEGITPSRRSQAVTLRLGEWRRKFNLQTVKAPDPTEAVWIEPPISDTAAGKMSDAQWLQAISHYENEHGLNTRDGGLIGGVHQLSQVLERHTEAEPQRFADLVLRLPDTAHPYYFDAILQGISGKNLSVSTVLQVCQRCHALPSHPCGRWICRPIEAMSKGNLPDGLLDIVAWYATEDDDPPADEDHGQNGMEMTAGRRNSFDTLNTARGSAALTMSRLIFDDGGRLPHFLPALSRMVLDSSLVVRAGVARTLIAVLRHERDQAVGLFQTLCAGWDGPLEATAVQEFLFYAVQTHYDVLLPLIERMMASNIPNVASTGARVGCFCSLMDQEHPLVRRCLMGSPPLRLGAAQVFAAHLRLAPARTLCEGALTQLFNDPDAAVRDAAAQCFRGLEGVELGQFTKLIEAFAASRSMADEASPLLHAMERTTAKLPDVTCTACEKFLDIAGPQAADVRTSLAGDAITVSVLVIRAYSQTDDTQIQARCLNLIDRMSQMGAHGLDGPLSLFDR